ncbi:hypothetical protein M9Y10_031797 [Tritrichomonas musculus]|uniref:Protein kinase domain-containing protein n=1 Tax=Tritrichomonas musculus TaxID=1915356 RepID=A0ABR2GZT0_9EUKA
MIENNIKLDIDRYKIISKIGEGGFSQVYRVKDLKDGHYYAAKVANFMVNEETKDLQQTHLLFREVNLMSLLNHPAILRFIGYYSTNFDEDPVPTIITDLATNGSLRNLIEMESLGLSHKNWDITKKLIIIYGIASGMTYLHSHNVLHRDLKPENILIDEYLHPMISDFGLSKITDFLSISMNFQSQKGLKGTPIYMSPEILTDENYSKAGDVYAFAFIVFELMSGFVPLGKMTVFQLIKKIVNQGYRPNISEDIPDAYKKLIESCWSEKADDRPTFSDIVENLKNNKEFITEATDENEFYDYVEFIDSYETTFDVSNRVAHYADFIKNHGRKKTIHTFNLKINEDENIEDENKEEQSNAYDLLYPLEEFNKLNKSCQSIVEEARNDAEKEFIIAKSLIEGQNEFPKNVEIGLSYLEQANKQKYLDSKIYYIRMLIKGNIVPQNLKKAEIYLSEVNSVKDKRLFVLRGLFLLKFDKYAEAVKQFHQGMNAGDSESTYKYAKMLYLGKGIEKNRKEALKFFNLSKERGFKKSEYFLTAFKTFHEIFEFDSLPEETQVFLISVNMKALMNNEQEFDHILIQSEKVEKLYYNKSLISSDFHECLKKYRDIHVVIHYPISAFGAIVDLIIKIDSIIHKKMKIGIIFYSFPTPIPEIAFSNEISYHIIDPSTKVITRDAFYGRSLKQISIPSSIISIEKNAFKECKLLKQLTFEDHSSLISIGENAFFDCKLLEQIVVPDTVTFIGDGAFGGCQSLKQMKIPSKVEVIGPQMFYRCLSLTNLTFSSSVTKIGSYAFFDCNSLTEITIPNKITAIEEYSFNSCSSLKQFTIAPSVKSVGKYAFYGCSLLTEMKIPSSVSSIGECVFYGCSSLEQIIFESIPSFSSIGSYCFYNCSSLSCITIPSSVNIIDKCAFSNCSSLTQISFEKSEIKEINECTFSGCSSLKQITIPPYVKSIGPNAFYGCSSLEQVSISSPLKSIGEGSFQNCSSLQQIEIPYSLSSIGMKAFEGCSELQQIEIPSTVSSIEKNTFYGCSSLKEVLLDNYSSLIKKIGLHAFYGCSSLTRFAIPNRTVEIGTYAFYGCTSLTKVSIPRSVVEIGSFAFMGCSSLKQIIIPRTVTQIGLNAFAECSSLSNISVPSSFNKNYIGLAGKSQNFD